MASAILPIPCLGIVMIAYLPLNSSEPQDELFTLSMVCFLFTSSVRVATLTVESEGNVYVKRSRSDAKTGLTGYQISTFLTIS